MWFLKCWTPRENNMRVHALTMEMEVSGGVLQWVSTVREVLRTYFKTLPSIMPGASTSLCSFQLQATRDQQLVDSDSTFITFRSTKKKQFMLCNPYYARLASIMANCSCPVFQGPKKGEFVWFRRFQTLVRVCGKLGALEPRVSPVITPAVR